MKIENREGTFIERKSITLATGEGRNRWNGEVWAGEVPLRVVPFLSHLDQQVRGKEQKRPVPRPERGKGLGIVKVEYVKKSFVVEDKR